MHKINFGEHDWMQRVGDTIGEMSYWFREAGHVIPERDKEEKHFVYVVTDTSNTYNDVVYIGSGQGTRYRHVLSGTSHNRKLNEMFFNKEELHVMMFEDSLSSKDSLQLEKELIAFFNPTANTVGKTFVANGKYLSPFDELRNGPRSGKKNVKNTKIAPPISN